MRLVTNYMVLCVDRRSGESQQTLAFGGIERKKIIDTCLHFFSLFAQDTTRAKSNRAPFINKIRLAIAD